MPSPSAMTATSAPPHGPPAQPSLVFVYSRLKPSPGGSVFSFPCQMACPTGTFKRCPPAFRQQHPPHPLHSPHSLRFELCGLNQNKAHAARFSVLKAQTCPLCDFPNATRQHSNNLTNLGPHNPFTSAARGFSKRAMAIAWGCHWRFEVKYPTSARSFHPGIPGPKLLYLPHPPHSLHIPRPWFLWAGDNDCVGTSLGIRG